MEVYRRLKICTGDSHHRPPRSDFPFPTSSRSHSNTAVKRKAALTEQPRPLWHPWASEDHWLQAERAGTGVCAGTRSGVGQEGCLHPRLLGRRLRGSGIPTEHWPSSAAGALIQGYLKFQLFMCSCCGLMLTDTKTLPRFSFIKILSPLWTASLSPISFKGNRVLKSLLRNSWATNYNLTFPPSQILGLHYHGNMS